MEPVWTFLGWIAVLGGAAVAFPDLLKGLGPWIPVLLGAVMFGMGMTLVPADFVRVAKRPLPVAAGIFLQFAVMPVTGFLAAHLTGADPVILLGFVLVGACPGGTASNVISYFARADVPLSVSMTAVSTMLAPLFTPLWTKALGGHTLEVSFTGLAASTLKVVVVPAVLGMVAGRWRGRLRERVDEILPSVSGFLVALIIAIIVAGSRDRLAVAPFALIAGVVLHNGFGMAAGYFGARLCGLAGTECRTVSIEVGMQNSGLAAALAAIHFPAGAGLPAAIFSVCQNLTGALAAAIWRTRPPVR